MRATPAFAVGRGLKEEIRIGSVQGPGRRTNAWIRLLTGTLEPQNCGFRARGMAIKLMVSRGPSFWRMEEMRRNAYERLIIDQQSRILVDD